MASTDDCKKLLATDPLTKNEVGVWKRISKKNVNGVVQRTFSCTSGAEAIISEDDQGNLTVTSGQAPGVVPDPANPVQAAPARAKAAKAPAKVKPSTAPNPAAPPKDPACAAYLFALLYDKEEDQVFLAVVTKTHWAKNKFFMDSELPIENLVPGGAPGSPNGSSVWETSGFTDASHMAQAMLDKGFEFSPELQKFCNNICPYPEQSWEARKAIKRLQDIHAGKPVKTIDPYGKRKIPGGTAEPEFTIIQDAAYLTSLSDRIIANTARDEQRNKAMGYRAIADMQISLVVMPPQDDPKHKQLVDFLTENYIHYQAFSTTVIGVEFNSPAHAQLNKLLGPQAVGAVVGFQGHSRMTHETAETRPPTELKKLSKLSARMVDIDDDVKRLFNPKLKPKWS